MEVKIPRHERANQNAQKDDDNFPAPPANESWESIVPSRGPLRFDKPPLQRLNNLEFALLPVRVQLVELRRQIARFIFFFSFEEFDYCLRHVHASRGIHARRNAEGDIRGRQLTLLVRKLRYCHEGPQPGIARIAQSK